MDQIMQQMYGQGGFDLNELSGIKTLVEFKAGKMKYEGRMVTPDRRRGIVKVIQDAEGMKQFHWCDADTGNKIEGFIIFPDESRFVKVKQSKDRVYLLEMKSTRQRHFYWIQEEDQEKDADFCKKVHNILNDIKEEPPKATPATAQSTTGQQPVNQIQQPNQQDWMNQFFNQLNVSQQQKKDGPELPDIITQDAMLKLIQDDEEVKKILIPHLPETQQQESLLEDNLRSSQLRQAMKTLTEAIQSDQAEVIFISCGLDLKYLRESDDPMKAFIKALVEKHKK